MTLLLEQQQLRHTSRVNILVLLLMLFVISGHCSTAMAQVNMPAMHEHLISDAEALEHCGSMGSPVDEASDGPCWDDHCPEAVTPLQAQSSKLSKQDLDSPDLFAGPAPLLPDARAGPCDASTSVSLGDFVTPPLYYTLCVLRL